MSAVGDIRSHNLLIDSPASYRWAITAETAPYKILEYVLLVQVLKLLNWYLSMCIALLMFMHVMLFAIIL